MLRLSHATSLIGCLLVLGWSACRAGQEVAGVGRAFAGDIVIVRGAKIRLPGYELPAADETCAKGQAAVPCVEAALEALRGLLGEGSVTCVLESKVGHGSYQGPCRLADGADLGEALVQRGLARAAGSGDGRYAAAEAEARAAGRGVWQVDR